MCHLHTYSGTVIVRSAALTTYETGPMTDPCMILAVILRRADIYLSSILGTECRSSLDSYKRWLEYPAELISQEV